MSVTTNEKYKMQNVISYREKMTNERLNEVMKTLNSFITENKLNKNGCITTTTYAIESSGIMDIEIFCPVDRECSVPDGFNFKPIFRLSNALKTTHTGNPATLQTSVNELMEYMKNNNLTPITSLYNVTVKEATTPLEIDTMVVDLYLGVTDNIL